MSFLLSISMTSNFSESILYLASTCYFALQIIVTFVVHICIPQRIVCILLVDSFISVTLTMNHFPQKQWKKVPKLKKIEKKTWHVPRWLGAFLAILLTRIWFLFCSSVLDMGDLLCFLAEWAVALWDDQHGLWLDKLVHLGFHFGGRHLFV